MEGRMLRDPSPAQLLTTLIGATFILVGILGFIPGITSHLYGGLDFAGATTLRRSCSTSSRSAGCTTSCTSRSGSSVWRSPGRP
jgi:Domain of unknown function (DUF4383)